MWNCGAFHFVLRQECDLAIKPRYLLLLVRLQACFVPRRAKVIKFSFLTTSYSCSFDIQHRNLNIHSKDAKADWKYLYASNQRWTKRLDSLFDILAIIDKKDPPCNATTSLNSSWIAHAFVCWGIEKHKVKLASYIIRSGSQTGFGCENCSYFNLNEFSYVKLWRKNLYEQK